VLKFIIDEVKTFSQDPLLLAVCILGLFMIVMGGNAVFQNLLGNYSQPVPAVVIESFVSTTSRTGEADRYEYFFEYQYEFEGEIYTSERYSFKSGGNSTAVSAHEAGDEIVAYVNPNRPNRAIIEKGISWLNYVWLGLGLLLVGRTLQMNSWYRK